MVLCPYCGEKIQAEARVCRHCQKEVVYSLTFIQPLTERQKYEFLKIWNSLPKSSFKYLNFSNLSQVKEELNRLPLTFAWDITWMELEKLKAHLSGFSFEVKLESEVLSEVVRSNENSLGWTKLAFGAAFLMSAITFFYFYNVSEKKLEVSQAPTSLIEKQPEIPVIILKKPIQEKIPESQTFSKRLSGEMMNVLLNATVFIQGENSLGSGFLITPDGYLLSNAHVTHDMEKPVVILRTGQKFSAEKVREDSRYDIALLKIAWRSDNYLSLGDANKLYPGQTILTIGNPGGLSFTVTKGIVSFLGRQINGVFYIQTDAAINPGNSGGPMINEDMEVVGINTLTAVREQGISFALPINLACDENGITRGFRTKPLRCPSFHSAAETTVQAAFQGEGRVKNNYQEDAKRYEEKLKKETDFYTQEETRLQQELNKAQGEKERYPLDLSLNERLQKKIVELQKKIQGIVRQKAESQLYYVNQMITLLERQKGDPSFQAYASQIQQQIEKLKDSKNQIQNFLN